MSILVEISAVVTGLSSLGVLGFAARIYAHVKEHDRVIYGEDAVQGWNGLLGMVQEHREVLAELEEVDL